MPAPLAALAPAVAAVAARAIPAIAGAAARAIPAVANAAGRAAGTLAARAAGAAESQLGRIATQGGTKGRLAGAASTQVRNLSPMFQNRVSGAVANRVTRVMTSAVARAEGGQQEQRPQRVSNTVSNNLSSVQGMLSQGGVQASEMAKRSSR